MNIGQLAYLISLSKNQFNMLTIIFIISLIFWIVYYIFQGLHDTHVVKEVELENENGFLVYNVSILFNRQEWEVLVDAGSGLVLTVDTDD